jgi:hypothetical protein
MRSKCAACALRRLATARGEGCQAGLFSAAPSFLLEFSELLSSAQPSRARRSNASPSPSTIRPEAAIGTITLIARLIENAGTLSRWRKRRPRCRRLTRNVQQRHRPPVRLGSVPSFLLANRKKQLYSLSSFAGRRCRGPKNSVVGIRSLRTGANGGAAAGAADGLECLGCPDFGIWTTPVNRSKNGVSDTRSQSAYRGRLTLELVSFGMKA